MRFSATVKSPMTAVAHPLLGHVGEPGRADRRAGASRRARRRRARIEPRSGGRRPAIASASSRCPLPDTPAMPTISPARTSSDSPRTASVPRSPVHAEVADREPTAPPAARRTAPRPRRPGARPSSRPARSPVASAPRHRADLPPAAQHGDAVGELEHLVDLVRDEHEAAGRRPTICLRTTNSSSTSCGVRTAVGSSRTSSDDVAVQRLDDLDALALADRQLPDDGLGVDLEPVGLATARGSAPRPGRGRSAARAWTSRPARRSRPRSASCTSMKCWWIIPIPCAIASAGEVMATWLAVEPDLALVGLVQAVEHAHQGALACAVLAEEGVDLAGAGRRSRRGRWRPPRGSAW